MPNRGLRVESWHGCMTGHHRYRYFNSLDPPLPIMKYVIVTGGVMSGLRRDKTIADMTENISFAVLALQMLH